MTVDFPGRILQLSQVDPRILHSAPLPTRPAGSTFSPHLALVFSTVPALFHGSCFFLSLILDVASHPAFSGRRSIFRSFYTIFFSCSFWRVDTNLSEIVSLSAAISLGSMSVGVRLMLIPPAWLLVLMYFCTCSIPFLAALSSLSWNLIKLPRQSSPLSLMTLWYKLSICCPMYYLTSLHSMAS